MATENGSNRCVCGHERHYHDPETAHSLKCLAHCDCQQFRDPRHDPGWLRQRIADHRLAIEIAGDVRVIGRRSRANARRKHRADQRLWEATRDA